jgi:hypothetical protein
MTKAIHYVLLALLTILLIPAFAALFLLTAPLLTASLILELAQQRSQHFYFPLALS